MLLLVLSFLAVLAVCLYVRLPLLRRISLKYDAKLQTKWMVSATLVGVPETFTVPYATRVPNHGPAEILFMDFFGHLYEWWNHADIAKFNLMQMVSFMKMPSLLADLGICVALFLLFVRLGSPWQGIVAAAVYALQPIALINFRWGQTDSIVAFLILAGLVAYFSNHETTSGLFFALAYISKPTGALAFPLLLFLLVNVRKHWKVALGALDMLFLFSIYFIVNGSFSSLLRYLLFTPTMESAKALNFAWLLDQWHAQVFMFNSFPSVLSDHLWSYLVFFALSSLFLYSFRRSLNDARSMIVAISMIAFLFFFIQVGVRNRHIFSFIVLAIPMLFVSWEGVAIYSLTTLCAYVDIVRNVGRSHIHVMDAIVHFLHFSNLTVAYLYAGLCVWLLWFTVRTLRPRALSEAIQRIEPV